MLMLKELKWGNCFSYGDNNSINLSDNTITQLIGVNGSGKSSIALIIQEALYNKNSKGIKKADIPNRELGNSYWINLTFAYDAKEYEVQLDRKSTLKVKLKEDGVDISSHTATDTFKSIEKILGLDFKGFVQLMYQSVTEGLTFLTATDTNRKKFLIDLFGLDEYEKYHDIFKKLLQDINLEISRVKGSIDSVQKWVDKNKEVGELKECKPVPDLNINEDELWSLKDRVSNIKDTNRKINNNNKLKELLQGIKFDEALVKENKLETSHISSRVGEITASLRSLNTFLTKTKNLGDKCPTCEQDIQKDLQSKFIEDTQKEIDSLEKEKAALEQELSAANSFNKNVEFNKNKKREWESIFTQIDRDLTSSIEDIDYLVNRVSEVEKEIQNQKSYYNSVLSENAEIEKHNSRVAVISQQLEEHSAELSKLEELLHVTLSKFSTLEVLKKAFSTNGLVAHKLENLVKDIEELANEYLAELSDGRFTLQFTVSSDKLNVVLTDAGREIDIAPLSSGELARVNSATLLAIRKMMNSISKTQINILFLDEVINVLDEFGREKLVEVLLREEGLNTFLVSHGWSHPLLEKVEIIKSENISRLKHG